MSKGFTLVELLVVLAIIAVLGTAVVLTVNPAELVRQSRDSSRLSDMAALRAALEVYISQNTDAYLGVNGVLYTSIPDASPVCANTELAVPPDGFSYACGAPSTYRATNGNGWLPVNFKDQAAGSPFGQLPIDPINSASAGSNFYRYAVDTTNKKWEADATLESQKYASNMTIDGGDDDEAYEIGSAINLLSYVWSEQFDDFVTATHNSNAEGWYLYSGAPLVSNLTEGGVKFLRVNGFAWYAWQESIPFDPMKKYKITCRARQVSDPTAGGKFIYCGFAAVAADNATLLNISGNNNYSSQHYHAASSNQLASGAGYTTFIGYSQGYGTPNGQYGPCSNPSVPCLTYSGTAYIRPLFILNYSDGNGVADIDYISVEEVD